MIEEIKEMLKEKASLEREYLELVNISGEMNLSAEIHDRLIMANIAHSLSVIADALADRKTEQAVEPQADIHDLTDCDFCRHNSEGWDSKACDSCCENNNHFEPKTEPQAEREGE